MPRSLDEVARVWAARKLKLPVERIGEVHFDAQEGYYYSEITNADPRCWVTIEVTGYSRSPRTRYRDFNVLEMFDEVLNQLVAIAQEETGTDDADREDRAE